MNASHKIGKLVRQVGLALASAGVMLAATTGIAHADSTPTASTAAKSAASVHGKSLTIDDLRAMQRAQQGTVSPAFVNGNIRNWGASGKCIGISTGLAGDWYCTSNGDQKWHWSDEFYDGNGILWGNLRNGNNQCLAVNGRSTSAGARILGYSCVGSVDQYWAVTYNSWSQLVNYNGFYSGSGNDVVGVAGGLTSNGAELVLWWPDGSPNQTWDVVQ